VSLVLIISGLALLLAYYFPVRPWISLVGGLLVVILLTPFVVFRK
jgi:membrane protein YdbS with pleckstrin-like domain